jgi:hypothetical protein
VIVTNWHERNYRRKERSSQIEVMTRMSVTHPWLLFGLVIFVIIAAGIVYLVAARHD